MSVVIAPTQAFNDTSVTARTFGMGDATRLVWNLAGQDSNRAILMPVLYKQDWSGISQYYSTARTNLVIQSQTLDNVSWTKSGLAATTVTADSAVAPDGTTTADHINEAATSAEHYIERAITASAGTWCISAYAQAAERTKFFLCGVHVGDGSTTSSVCFDLSAGTKSAANGTQITSSGITSIGNGWYRCWIVFTTTALCTSLRCRLQSTDNTAVVSYAGTLNYGVNLTKVQFESVPNTTSTPTGYIPTTTTAVTVTDYQNPATRTNLLVNSNAFTGYGKATMTVTPGATDPLGGTTATTLTAGGATSYIYQAITYPSFPATNSVWVRRRTGTGTIQLAPPDFSSFVTIAVTSTWQRFSATGGTGTNRWGIVIVTSGDEIDIWQGQAEVGSVATPYIATGAARVTVPSTDLISFPTAPAAAVPLMYKEPHLPSSNVYRHFGVGDGSNQNFSLPFAPAAPAIYKRDWAGNQLMYASARTNKCLQSQTFGTTWAILPVGSVVLTENDTTAPDGTSTADKFLEAAVTDFHSFYQGVTVTPSTTYTVSSYVKPIGRTYFNILESNTLNALLEVDTGAMTAAASGTSATGGFIVALSNGWYRIGYTLTTGVAQTQLNFRWYLKSTPATSSYAGDITKGIYVWGAQVEAGTSATAYILTTTAAASATDYTLDAAGRGDVTFAAAPAAAKRTNLVTKSEATKALLSASGGTPAVADVTLVVPGYASVNAISFPATVSVNQYAYYTATVTTGLIYSISAIVQMADSTQPVLGLSAITGDFSFVLGSLAVTTGTATYDSLGSGVYRVNLSGVASGGTGALFAGCIKYTTQSAKAFTVSCVQVELYPSVTAYIKTAGAAVDDYTWPAPVLTWTGTMGSAR